LRFGKWLFINDLIWHGWPGRSPAMTTLAYDVGITRWHNTLAYDVGMTTLA
jgi:hypothetical protein